MLRSYVNVKFDDLASLERKSMKIPSTLPIKIVVPLLLISVIGTAVAVTTLFTHTFPAIQVVSPAGPPLTTTCATPSGTSTPTLVLTPSSITTNTNGQILAQCPGGAPAFTTNFPLGSTVTTTPTFVLPNGITGIDISFHTTGTTCSQLYTSITSGVAFTVPNGDWDYCLIYSTSSTAGTIPSFTVDWTSNP